MAQIDIEALRERIRQMDFERGTPEQIALGKLEQATIPPPPRFDNLG